MSITFREIVIVLYGKKGTCSLVKIHNDRASLPDNIITRSHAESTQFTISYDYIIMDMQRGDWGWKVVGRWRGAYTN